MASNNPAHVLFMPFPVQGHINPMLQFAKRLASKGLTVTLGVTSSISSSLLSEYGAVKVVSICDGKQDLSKREWDNSSSEQPSDDTEDESKKALASFQSAVSRSLIKLIEKQNCKDSRNPIKVLVYDSMMPWALDIGHQLGLLGVSFFTQSCVVSLIYHHMYAGSLHLPTDGSVVSVPQSSVLLKVHDLPSFIYDTRTNSAIVKTVVDQFSNFMKADCLVFNSFDKLEDEVVNWMKEKWRIKTIGPAIPSMYTDKRLKDDADYDLNLFPTDQDNCKQWLDTKNKRSVVYVSFGSIANLKEEQMTELAFGLLNSDISFLWVVRASEQTKLPTSFLSKTSKSRCLIVNWCSQLQVLSHEAIGCFMTHCGWNSTLEALSLGVPVVAMPQWTDQTTNAKFIVDVWQIGVRVKVNEKEVATRENIISCLKEVMEGEKGIELKTNALRFMELGKIAMDEGGSSDINISEFVATICKATTC